MTLALPLLALSAALLLPGAAAAQARPCEPQPDASTGSDAAACTQQAASTGTVEFATAQADALGLGCRRWSIGALAAGMRGGQAPGGLERSHPAARACAVRELYARNRPQPVPAHAA